MNKIKELRLKKGISQITLAKLLKTTQANISGWENGKWEPDFDNVKIMADYFGVTLDELLSRNIENAIDNESLNFKSNKNIVTAIGRGGKRTTYELSDSEAELINSLLEELRKKK